MLNREKAPIMGVWNGIGGKNEVGETADEGAIREVFEETGFKVNQYYSKVSLHGILVIVKKMDYMCIYLK